MAQTSATAPLVRASITPSENIVIGQPVLLHVEVLFPGEMPRPPLVKIAETSGAQIMRFETQAITIRDRIESQDYVGQRFEFIVFPRRGGDIDLPAADVTLLDRAGDPIGAAKGQPLRFAVTVPAGIDPSGPVLAAPSVSVSQTWSPDPASTPFKAGGAITRTIQRQAADVPALGMVEFHVTAPAGVRAYVDPPLVNDTINRGAVKGSRTDKITYVFEKAGTYVLPALSQPWWDTKERQARSETLPGVTIAVAAIAVPWQSKWRALLRDWPAIAIALSIGILLLVLWVRFWPRLATAGRQRRERYLNSETCARKALRKAAKTGDAAATYRALQIWLARLSSDARRDLAQNAPLLSLIDQLERSLFAQAGAWPGQCGKELAALVTRAGRGKTAKKDIHASPLPALNPPSR
ncbi:MULTISPECIES: BatD family protein [unclassified Beijerinckia]|uniref:BatD family protein n=1 Tax=unclassified Beijerinckia TaxID=2638183 RepID=UPI001480AB27|nr:MULTISPECIES: BatD family protein [unclassified Beijerinckia]